MHKPCLLVCLPQRIHGIEWVNERKLGFLIKAKRIKCHTVTYLFKLPSLMDSKKNSLKVYVAPLWARPLTKDLFHSFVTNYFVIDLFLCFPLSWQDSACWKLKCHSVTCLFKLSCLMYNKKDSLNVYVASLWVRPLENKSFVSLLYH